MSARLKVAPADVAAAIERLVSLSRRRPCGCTIGHLIDGTSDQPLSDAGVVFDATTIHEVTMDSTRPSPDILCAAESGRGALRFHAVAVPSRGTCPFIPAGNADRLQRRSKHLKLSGRSACWAKREPAGRRFCR